MEQMTTTRRQAIMNTVLDRGIGIMLANLIQRGRYKAGLSRRELAEKIGSSEEYIYKLETGIIKNPSAKMIKLRDYPLTCSVLCVILYSSEG